MLGETRNAEDRHRRTPGCRIKRGMTRYGGIWDHMARWRRSALPEADGEQKDFVTKMTQVKTRRGHRHGKGQGMGGGGGLLIDWLLVRDES